MNEEDTVTVGQDLVRLELGGAPEGGKKEATPELPKEAEEKPKESAEPEKPKETPAPKPAAPEKPKEAPKAETPKPAEAKAAPGNREERRVGAELFFAKDPT